MALAQVLDQKPGTEVPWYHVQVGGTQGYVSGRYVSFPEDWAEFVYRASSPCPVVTAVAGRSVVTDMDGGGALCVAEAGRRMRVLAETEDGWLHVAPG